MPFVRNTRRDRATRPASSVPPAAAASSQCVQCPVGSTPNVAQTACECRAGFFTYDPGASPVQCEPCPLGAVCDEPGSTAENIKAASGWYRVYEGSASSASAPSLTGASRIASRTRAVRK